MAKKKNSILSDYWWVILIFVLLYGGQQGWFKSIINNYESSTTNNAYTNTTETQLQQQAIIPQDTSLTCAEIAQQNNADYYGQAVNSAKECMDYAVLDCQDKGKTLDGYGVINSCCYYVCVAVVPEEQPVQPTCTDSDGGQDDQQFIKGTVSFNGVNYVDQCDWGNGGITEYYCDGNIAKMMNIQCENYWSCQDGKCAQQLCEDIMNPTPEKCAAGYTTDGGTCEYWAMNGGMCLSSFG